MREVCHVKKAYFPFFVYPDLAVWYTFLIFVWLRTLYMKILYHAKLYINRLTSLGIFCFCVWSSHDGMELMDARYRWYGFTKEVIAGYVLEGIFILLYSWGVIPVCCLKYLLKKDRLLKPKEKAISFTVKSVDLNCALASIVIMEEMISKGVSPIAFLIVVQKWGNDKFNWAA